MVEILGRLDPGADTSMLTDYDSLTRLEQAEVTLALCKQVDRIISEAEQSETGLVMGKFIVALEDGRVIAPSHTVHIVKKQEK